MNRNTKNIGDVWWCDVYFTNPETGILEPKERPVVVINKDEGIASLDLEYSEISSQRPRGKYDYQLKFWKEAGLRKPSIVRCNKNHYTPSGQLKRRIGTLHPEDLANVLTNVKLWAESAFVKVKENNLVEFLPISLKEKKAIVQLLSLNVPDETILMVSKISMEQLETIKREWQEK